MTYHIFDSLDEALNQLKTKVDLDNTFVITDVNIAASYVKPLKIALTLLDNHIFVMPSGEKNKTVAMAQQLWTWLIENNANRHSHLIGFGGGVVTDLTGFVASTYFRGIQSYFIPTSVIGQVDAAIGGKTAVNLPEGKNLIGTFYLPKSTFVPIDTLQTLPDREYHAGLAEVVKSALIAGESFFGWLERNADKIVARDKQALAQMVALSLEVKTNCIENDLHDTKGERAKLNLGHTLGHALECYGEYKRWLHGEAVAIGLLFSLQYSVEFSHLGHNVLHRTKDLVQNLKIPTLICGDCEPAHIFNYMLRDKKNDEGAIYLLIMKQLGEVKLTPIVPDDMFASFTSMFLESQREASQ